MPAPDHNKLTIAKQHCVLEAIYAQSNEDREREQPPIDRPSKLSVFKSSFSNSFKKVKNTFKRK